MLKHGSFDCGFEISDVATCDFSSLEKLDNETLFARLGKGNQGKLVRFIERTMGARRRYHCDPDSNALDLARSALSRLLERNPELVEDAEFFIMVGISNPMPITTTSALLAGEFGFKKVSCWDIKSGCSAGVLALIQALQWIQSGAKSGVIVSSETLSKFSNPEVLQMSAAIGDGGTALKISASDRWRVRGMVHGTDPSLVRTMMVKGTFPIKLETYNPSDYLFSFEQKVEVIEAIGKYWIQSLQELLEVADVNPASVTHYIAHQVDASKNAAVANHCDINPDNVARSFAEYGNMGAPTVFVNYHDWVNRPGHHYQKGDNLVFHAVGGGVSWAGLCLEYLG